MRILHLTEYFYPSGVFLEPQRFRFKPKNTTYNHLESFKIKINPPPAGLSETFDADGNHLHFCWFQDMNERLTIEAESIISVSDYNPFNFIIYPDRYMTIPFQYAPKVSVLLKPALITEPLDDQLIQYGKSIIKRTKDRTFDFILELTKQTFSDFTLESRESGQPHKANGTFRLKKGSCRDLAWLEIQLLRYFGIAARFVSGYYFLPAEEPEFELHAWIETYIPGAGWIGFDPSHGLATGTAYIPVASSAFYEKTMPVTGFVRGQAGSDLKTEIQIDIID